MIKILPVNKIKEADQYTIENEPIASIDLMERASKRIAEWIELNIKTDRRINIVSGPGNNGGDGLALARKLSDQDYDVNVFLLNPKGTLSEDNKKNYDRLKGYKDVILTEIKEQNDIPGIKSEEVYIDAIFGSGLDRKVTGLMADVINQLNDSSADVISIDAPSGLFIDRSNAENKGAIMKATHTLTFQFPKLAFMFSDNSVYTGSWETIPIDLHPDFIQQVETNHFFLESADIKKVIKGRKKFSHKGNFGHALLIAGKYSSMGAAVLAARSCLRTGAGLLTSHVPGWGYNIIQNTVPEALTSIDESNKSFTEVPELSHYQAIGIGPGIGTAKETQDALKLLIQNASLPILFDADALNILGENKTWISFVPKNSIFTPHPKEFERIAGKSSDAFERLEQQRQFSIKYGVYVILKGAHTSISCPDGTVYFNSTGNPGMATAGSGDVLTGIILGLISQNYTPRDACIIGVYLHGLAGDNAALEQGWESLIASDIISHLGKAYNQLKT
ncbi:MAG: NAD(P)H-hydrate dehydratase [Bacteroidales bacterium]|nr:NAD(P)H-hydrate dehydratase [Bacteroidales bacterium]